MAFDYAKLRTNRLFLFCIVAFCAGWAIWNLTPGLPHFDDGSLGRLTTILSIEASIAASLILAHGERTELLRRKHDEEAERARQLQDERYERVLRHIADLMEAQAVQLKVLQTHFGELREEIGADDDLGQSGSAKG